MFYLDFRPSFISLNAKTIYPKGLTGMMCGKSRREQNGWANASNTTSFPHALLAPTEDVAGWPTAL